jgi:hypothetical protein
MLGNSGPQLPNRFRPAKSLEVWVPECHSETLRVLNGPSQLLDRSQIEAIVEGIRRSPGGPNQTRELRPTSARDAQNCRIFSDRPRPYVEARGPLVKSDIGYGSSGGGDGGDRDVVEPRPPDQLQVLRSSQRPYHDGQRSSTLRDREDLRASYGEISTPTGPPPGASGCCLRRNGWRPGRTPHAIDRSTALPNFPVAIRIVGKTVSPQGVSLFRVLPHRSGVQPGRTEQTGPAGCQDGPGGIRGRCGAQCLPHPPWDSRRHRC